MWHIWPGRLYPALIDDELNFYAQLQTKKRKSKAPYTHDDVVALMGILRCGADLEGALDLAPGLVLPALRSAYKKLESQRAKSVKAWQTLLEKPTLTTLHAQSKAIRLLLPVVIDNITSDVQDGTELVSTINSYNVRIREMTNTAKVIEIACSSSPPGSSQLLEASSQLYAVRTPSVYTDHYYLPDRVSSLSPLRVNNLLGYRKH
jgi:hypothetical protein